MTTLLRPFSRASSQLFALLGRSQGDRPQIPATAASSLGPIRKAIVTALSIVAVLAAVACRSTIGPDGSTKPGDGSGAGASVTDTTVGAVAITLAEAAEEAARTSDTKVVYNSDSTSRSGTLVLAIQGDKISWRIDQRPVGPGAFSRRGPSSKRDSAGAFQAFVLERAGQVVFCSMEERWRCLEGPSNEEGGLGLFDRKSLGFLAQAARSSIAEESYRRYTRQIAGQEAVCFDLVPQLQLFESPDTGKPPSAEATDENGASGGFDEEIPPLKQFDATDPKLLGAVRTSVVVEVLYRGGTLCFAASNLVRVAVLGPDLFQMTAVEVSKPTGSDFEPPAVPESVESPSPYPSVLELN
jgi:hypothetical protein